MAEQLIRELCLPDRHALKPSQVVVLTPGYAKDHWPGKFRNINFTTEIDKWRVNEGVLIASLHQFKGLEADAVVLLTPPLPEKTKQVPCRKLRPPAPEPSIYCTLFT